MHPGAAAIVENLRNCCDKCLVVTTILTTTARFLQQLLQRSSCKVEKPEVKTDKEPNKVENIEVTVEKPNVKYTKVVAAIV